MKRVFYYHFKALNEWLVINALLGVVLCVLFLTSDGYFPCQLWVLSGLFVISCLLWGWKYLLKHPVAVITDESIQIDRCAPLKWKDVKSAREEVVKCGLMRYRVIILEPKKNIKYRYNLLQKHNCGFTPFSVPIDRNISLPEAQKMADCIAQKTQVSYRADSPLKH